MKAYNLKYFIPQLGGSYFGTDCELNSLAPIVKIIERRRKTLYSIKNGVLVRVNLNSHAQKFFERPYEYKIGSLILFVKGYSIKQYIIQKRFLLKNPFFIFLANSFLLFHI